MRTDWVQKRYLRSNPLRLPAFSVSQPITHKDAQQNSNSNIVQKQDSNSNIVQKHDADTNPQLYAQPYTEPHPHSNTE
jgi:hypothetical protein